MPENDADAQRRRVGRMTSSSIIAAAVITVRW